MAILEGMIVRRRRWRWLSTSLLLALVFVLAGCSSRDHTAAFTPSPEPTPGLTPAEYFFVQTPNYIELYQPGHYPFSPNAQFTSAYYPVPVAYTVQTPEPEGLTLPTASERAVRILASADRRIAIISGVAPGGERLRIYLVQTVQYGDATNIIGLTMLRDTRNGPVYDVYVSTDFPAETRNVSITKTLVHELGHVFGLGHSPHEPDLMYYRVNALQLSGLTDQQFLTYGDASTLWSTLNLRQVTWVPDRPAVQYPPVQQVTRQHRAITQTPADGTVICVYTRP